MSELKNKGTRAALTDPGTSAQAKYSLLVVGLKGLLPLLKYEFITSLFGGCPGSLGMWLRRKFYPVLFKKTGSNLTIGRNVSFRHPGRISLGSNVVIGDDCTLDAKGTEGEGILIRDGVFIGKGTILSMADGTIEIDDGANIGSYCRIGTLGHTRIGKKVLLAAYCYLVGGGHETGRTDIPIQDQPNSTLGGVEIGDGCWLGARVTVMDGVRVGHDTIVGAHAVVREDLPEFSVAVGMPARVVKKRR